MISKAIFGLLRINNAVLTSNPRPAFLARLGQAAGESGRLGDAMPLRHGGAADSASGGRLGYFGVGVLFV